MVSIPLIRLVKVKLVRVRVDIGSDNFHGTMKANIYCGKALNQNHTCP